MANTPLATSSSSTIRTSVPIPIPSSDSGLLPGLQRRWNCWILGVPLRCAPGRAARAVGHDTTVAQRRRAPCASGQRYCCCPAAPGSRPCGRASLTQRQRPVRQSARGPHPPAPSPVHGLSAPSSCLPRTGEGEKAVHRIRCLPLSARNERGGPGEGHSARAGGRRPARPPFPNPSPEVGGGVARRREERAKRRAGERAPASAKRRPLRSLPRPVPAACRLSCKLRAWRRVRTCTRTP